MKRLLLPIAVLLLWSAPVISQARGGGWTYSSTKDEMTDEQRFHISTNSRPTTDDLGSPITGTIVWRCSASDGREVFVLLDKYFGGDADDQVLVETRFDSLPVDSAWWNQSVNNRGAFMPSEAIAAFTNRVERSRRLLVRVTDPMDGEAITYSFSLVGFTSAYRRLEPNCPRDETQPSSGKAVKDVQRDSEEPVETASNQLFIESAVEERPEVVSSPRLQYPDLLREAGVQGRVLVQAIIDTSGRAELRSVKVIQSPNPGFDQPAKQMVLGMLFRPARVHGRAVRVLVNVPIDFTIKR